VGSSEVLKRERQRAKEQKEKVSFLLEFPIFEDEADSLAVRQKGKGRGRMKREAFPVRSCLKKGQGLLCGKGPTRVPWPIFHGRAIGTGA